MGSVNVINKPGLQRLLMRSDKPVARQFQDWLLYTVLPSIEENGGYIMGQEKVKTGEMSDLEFLAKAQTAAVRVLDQMTKERDALLAANATMTSDTVRIIDQNGDPWFIAKDICDALGFSDTNAGTRHLDEDEKMTVNLTGISVTNPMVTIINESGLYSLILRSRKPEAKAFKKWVTSEVLPAIRRSGSYAVAVAIPNFSNPVEAARAWADQMEQRQALEAQTAALTSENTIMTPKAQVYDAVVADKDQMVHEFARKLHGVNSQGIKRDLKDLKYLYRLAAGYRVYSQYRDKYFSEKIRPDGKFDIYVTSEGKKLMTKLYHNGDLTMRANRKAA